MTAFLPRLPAGIPRPPGPLDAEHLRAAYRLAAKRLHPDAGGDRVAWDRLDQARRLLEDRL